MNMKWGEAGEDHNCYDFDRQENINFKENTNLRALQKKHEKEKHHGKKINLVL